VGGCGEEGGRRSEDARHPTPLLSFSAHRGPQIDQLGPPVGRRQEHVLRLDVAVHDADRVQRVERLQEVARHDRERRRAPARAALALQLPPEQDGLRAVGPLLAGHGGKEGFRAFILPQKPQRPAVGRGDRPPLAAAHGRAVERGDKGGDRAGGAARGALVHPGLRGAKLDGLFQDDGPWALARVQRRAVDGAKAAGRDLAADGDVRRAEPGAPRARDGRRNVIIPERREHPRPQRRPRQDSGDENHGLRGDAAQLAAEDGVERAEGEGGRVGGLGAARPHRPAPATRIRPFPSSLTCGTQRRRSPCCGREGRPARARAARGRRRRLKMSRRRRSPRRGRDGRGRRAGERGEGAARAAPLARPPRPRLGRERAALARSASGAVAGEGGGRDVGGRGALPADPLLSPRPSLATPPRVENGRPVARGRRQ